MIENSEPEQVKVKSLSPAVILLLLIALAALTFTEYVSPIISTIACILTVLLGYFSIKKVKPNPIPKSLLLLSLVAGWMGFINLFTVLFGKPIPEEIDIEIISPQTNFFGFSVNSSVVMSWVIILILALVAFIIRILVVPKFSDKPGKLQNLLEAAVEYVESYALEKAGHDYGMNLGAFIFSVAIFMVSCAALEMLAIRSPTADITITFSLGIWSFLIFNYFSIKHLGIMGKIKWLFKPTPMMMPIKVIIDIAKPVSMACRLYGNMLGGLIIMDLFFVALRYKAVGLSGLLGLFFNVFHPLVQVLIFVTLTLSFVAEASE